MLINEVSIKPLKIVILGSSKCGKSAVTVRYLTKRFIGEYISSKDFYYHQTLKLNNDCVIKIEILDTSNCNNSQCLNNHIVWGDAFVIVYSICDLNSFIYAKKLIENIFYIKSLLYKKYISNNLNINNNLNKQDNNENKINFNNQFLLNNNENLNTNIYSKQNDFQDFNLKFKNDKNNDLFSIILLGNKRDLEHIRQVMVEEGQEFALKFQCQFYEVSAAESFVGISLAFQSLIREIQLLYNFQLNNLLNLNLNKIKSKLNEKTNLINFPFDKTYCKCLNNCNLFHSLTDNLILKSDYSTKISSNISSTDCSSKLNNSNLKSNNLQLNNNRRKLINSSIKFSKIISIVFRLKLNKQKKCRLLTI